MKTILYLNEEGAIDVIGPLEGVPKQVIEHPLTIEYSVEEFANAFNRSEISHLGYITIKEDDT